MHTSIYLRPAANDVNDGLIELMEAGVVVPVRWQGGIRFAHRDQMKPEYAVVDHATAVRHLRRYEEAAMAVWN